MKRLNYFLVGLAALGMVFTSCEETEEPSAPKITFLNGISEAETAQDSFNIAGTITSEVGLDQVKLFKVTSLGEDQLKLVDKFDDKNSYDFKFGFSVSEDMTLKVSATDKDNNTTIRNFELTYTGGAGAIKSYNITLGSYNATEGSSFASIDGTVYKWADATSNSDKVDFLYYYGATNKASVAAPTNSDAQTVFSGLNGWSTKNDTKFGFTTLSASEFDAITDDSEIVSNASSLSGSDVNDLAVGDVFAFMTASTSAHASKAGLAKVVAIDDLTSSGTIDLAIKVQE